MKTTLRLIFGLFGLFIGAYVCIWVCFVGGIADILYQTHADIISKFDILWAIIKIILCVPFGIASALISMGLGGIITSKIPE